MQWNTSELGSTAPVYPGSLESLDRSPPSFYLSGKPSWWPFEYSVACGWSRCLGWKCFWRRWPCLFESSGELLPEHAWRNRPTARAGFFRSMQQLLIRMWALVPAVPLLPSASPWSQALSLQTPPSALPSAIRFSAANTPTSYAAPSLPSGLSVNGTTASSRELRRDPRARQTSTLNALNSYGTGAATLKLTIAAAPVTTPTTYTVTYQKQVRAPAR